MSKARRRMAPAQREQRFIAITRDFRRCQHCGATGRLDVELVDEHRAYEADNLRTVCSRCRLERQAAG